MKGLELCEKYYNEYGKTIFENDDVKDIFPKVAIGLIGEGSECLGYDDEVSTDHDFEPGFCIFLPDESVVDRKKEFCLERLYSKLPKEFMGFKRSNLSPVGGNRHGVIRVEDFLLKKLGRKDEKLSLKDWMTIEESFLLECVNGKIFVDNYGMLSNIREGLRYYPYDIKLKKLAGNLLLMSKSGQYNYNRCLKHNEIGGAGLACFEFVNSAINVIYLLNNTYRPYYKWAFKGLKELPILSQISDSLEFLISSENDKNMAETKYMMIEDISSMIIGELIDEGITKATCGDLEKHAYSINDEITDPEIRNLNILIGVKSI